MTVRLLLQCLAPLVVLAAGCTGPSPEALAQLAAALSPSPPLANEPPAQDLRNYPVLLATIDGNERDSVKINRYRSLLEQLDQSFVETPQQIANVSASAKEQLEKEGVSEGVLPIMEAMNSVLLVPIENQKYAEYTAMYMTLRTKGQSHEEATRGIRALIKAITSNP
jgi:hypothetical protein